MTTPEKPEAWIERATALLDRLADELDAATLSRLNRARQLALAERRTVPRRWMIGAGFAGTAALLFGIAFGLHQRIDRTRPPAAATPLQAADIDVLTSDDDTLDFYENLDFYAWLDAQEGGKSG